MKRAFSLLLVIYAAAMTSAYLAAKPFHIVMFYGVTLQEPVYLTEEAERAEFMLVLDNTAAVEAAHVELERPHIEVAIYWNAAKWRPYLAGELDLNSLDPENAELSARFYPEWQGKDARFVLTGPGVWPVPTKDTIRMYAVPSAVLRILESRGVPTRL